MAVIPATSASAGPVIVTKTQTTTVDAQCKYPILGVEPLSVRVALTGPSVIEAGSASEPLSVEIVATPGADFGPGLVLIDELASLEGSVSLATSVIAPGGGVTAAKVPVTIAPKPIDPITGTTEFTGGGRLALGTFDETGTVSIRLDGLAMNLLARDRFGDPILLPPVTRDINGVLVVDTDSDSSTFDVSCRIEPYQDTTLASFPIELEPVCNCGPPSRPTNLVGTPSQTSVALSWSASTDPDGIVVGYNVYRDGVKVTTVTGTTAVVAGLTPDTSYEFKVESIDDDGGTYASAPIRVTTDSEPIDTMAPSAPAVTAARTTSTTAQLSWTASTDDIGVVGYDVYRGDVLVATTSGLTATIAGLSVGAEYTFKVVAKDAAGNRSTPGTVVVDTGVVIETWVDLVTNMSGTASLKTMVKGSIPLRGTAVLRAWPAGFVSGELRINDSVGRLTALGFLPVTAKFGFVPSGQTTGSLQDGVLQTSSLMRIKVKEVKLFGAIPLAGGNTCQTKQLTRLNLRASGASAQAPLGTGLSGTFEMSDLNGCGALNGLVSPWTAGGGNTITLKASA
ncbi:MAG: fibronectin type III domain-containing protein [Solirubrobacteraceae bacterium]|nr:fibronectin type III domain-containing protein [Solirubrobacteraceae bacterium]